MGPPAAKRVGAEIILLFRLNSVGSFFPGRILGEDSCENQEIEYTSVNEKL
jgi:hypothetical protein